MNRSSLPADTEASATRRRTLSRHWETGEALAVRLALPAITLDAWRQSGKVLGVWIPEEGIYRYPAFQWRTSRELIDEMAPLLECLRVQMFKSEPTSGWQELEWLLGPHALLDSRAPADLLRIDPQRVLSVAFREFLEEAKSGW